MNVHPNISTAGEAPARYLAYLASIDWRIRRNAALKRAGWKCVECGARRDLQVHHVTYERLGREWDQDLRVLCVACHERKHPTEAPYEYVRHYLKLAREVLATESAIESLADFTEALKTRCAKLSLHYSSERLARAIFVVWRTQAAPNIADPAAAFVLREWNRPPSRAEARQTLRNIGALDAAEHVKTMPPAEYLLTTQRDADRQKALEMVAREIQASIDRCAALESTPVTDEGTP